MGEVRQGGLGLGSLNDLSGLWGTAAVPGCLAPDPGVMRAGGQLFVV